MRMRCQNTNRPDFRYYGGRGIVVCERWLDYSNFKEDMGPTWQKGMTLDRIDNDGPYAPENCRWTTRTEQSRNQRRTIFLSVDGVKKRLVEWAEITNTPVTTLYYRRDLGWSDRDVVFGESYPP